MDTDGILEILEKRVQGNPIDLVYGMSTILSLITKDSAPIILAFIRSFFSSKPTVPSYLAPSFNFLSERVCNKLKEHLPHSLRHHLPNLGLIQLQHNLEHLPVFDVLAKVVCEALVRTTLYEINSAITQLKPVDGDTSSRIVEADQNKSTNALFLKYFYMLNVDEQTLFVRHLAFLVAAEDVPGLLTYSSKNEEFAFLFFSALRIYNKAVFSLVCELVSTEKRFFKDVLVRSIPELEIEKVIPTIRPYNWDVLASLLSSRPMAAPCIIQSMKNGELSVSRRFFIERLKEQSEIFAWFYNELDLSADEASELIRSSIQFLQQYFLNAGSEEAILEVARVVSQKDEQSIIEFMEQNKEHANFVTFVRGIASTMRFSGELKSYVLDNLARRREFFHILITYLNLGEIEELFSKYYEKEISVEALLRKLHPQELIIEVHRFRDVLLATNILSECAASEKFSDPDWIFAMKALERTYSEAKMKTSLSLLKRRPRLRRQIITFMAKAINGEFWNSRILSVGLEKCMELLGEHSISLLEMLHRVDIAEILRRFPVVRKNLRLYFEKTTGEIPPRIYSLKKFLNEYPK